MNDGQGGVATRSRRHCSGTMLGGSILTVSHTLASAGAHIQKIPWWDPQDLAFLQWGDLQDLACLFLHTTHCRLYCNLLRLCGTAQDPLYAVQSLLQSVQIEAHCLSGLAHTV